MRLEEIIDRLKAIIGMPSDVEVTNEVLDEYARIHDSRPVVASSPRSSRNHGEHVSTQTSKPNSERGNSPIARTLLESMVEANGRLNMNENGDYDYNGNCSGLLLVERIRERCDSLVDREPTITPRPGHLQRSHSGTPSARSFLHGHTRLYPLTTLPSWGVALRYTNTAFSEAFSLFNFIHRPTFEAHLHDFYSARNAGLELRVEDIRFEGLLNSLFALGETFGGFDELKWDDTRDRATRA